MPDEFLRSLFWEAISSNHCIYVAVSIQTYFQRRCYFSQNELKHAICNINLFSLRLCYSCFQLAVLNISMLCRGLVALKISFRPGKTFASLHWRLFAVRIFNWDFALFILLLVWFMLLHCWCAGVGMYSWAYLNLEHSTYHLFIWLYKALSVPMVHYLHYIFASQNILVCIFFIF